MRRSVVVLLVVAALIGALLLAIVAWPSVEVQQVEVQGGAALVQGAGPPSVWVLTRHREVPTGLGAGFGEARLVFTLHGHDSLSTERQWSRRLLVLPDRAGALPTARLLGQQSTLVWAFVHDRPVRLSVSDGTVMGTDLDIAERNPGLRSIWPREARSFVFDGSLVVTTADALHWRIDPVSLAATAYQPVDRDAFDRARFMATQWSGRYRTEEFGVRHLRTLDGRWVGLYTEREAADAADDGFGSHFTQPDGVVDDGAQARRQLWLARLGRTRAFSEGTHERLEQLTPVGDGSLYLQGRLLRQPGESTAFSPGADGGGLILHRSRLGGPLVLTRIGADLAPRWSRELPIHELGQRWHLQEHVVLMGSAPGDDGRATQDWIVSLDLANGRLRGTHLQRPAGRR